MQLLFLFSSFIFGTLIGSFLNVVVLRHNTGKTLLGRSGCFSCRKQLGWAENIPVVSFLIQRGRCRHCRSRISFQYPFVEIFTGVLFALSFLRADSIAETVVMLAASMLLAALFVYDLRHMILPDAWMFSFIALGVLSMFLSEGGGFIVPEISQALAPFTVAAPFAFLVVISRGAWMGMGDVKLAFGIGAFLGISAGFMALMIAVFLGALVGVLLIALSKWRSGTTSMKSEIPFGPFLIIAFLFVYFFSEIALAPLQYLLIY